MPKEIEAEAPYARRVLIVDDRPEIRLLVRTRLQMLDDVDVVGEASNGAEALILVSALAPEAVVLDLEMPVMRGDEAIARMRELAPGMRILLYTGANPEVLAGINQASKPDAIVRKDASLTKLVEELRALLDLGPFDVLRIVLGSIPLEQAITAFDTWVGLNVRILEALARGDDLLLDQMSGATLEELQGLIGVYTHLGNSLQKAARQQASDVVLIIHLLRTTAAAARRALVAFDRVHLKDFYAAWGYEAETSALTALTEMRDRLMDALPPSSADERDGDSSAPTAAAIDRTAAANDRTAAAIDRAAAAQDRAAASTDELTGTYLRGPGHVELERELTRARRTGKPLVLAFIDVDGLKQVNDTQGHGAGDQLLREVAIVLREQSRAYDVIVRHGGDEFLCALPGISMEEAASRMELVHDALAAGPNQWTVTAGLAELEDDDTLETLIERADIALYAKRGENRGQS